MGVYQKSHNSSSRSLQSLDKSLVSVDTLREEKALQSNHRLKLRKRSTQYRCRRRLSQLLHTHVVLISVCILSALDASCVLGQIICDILIMSEVILQKYKESTGKQISDKVSTFLKFVPERSGEGGRKSIGEKDKSDPKSSGGGGRKSIGEKDKRDKNKK